MGERLSITLEVYLPFRGRRMWRGTESVAPGTTLGDLLATLARGDAGPLDAEHPGAGLGEPALTEPDLVLLLNGRRRPPDMLLAEGDEVAILRQSEGG